MKSSLEAKYDADKSAAGATLSVNVCDVKLRASMTDATLVNGPSLNGLALAVEKPGSFIIDYNVPKKDFRFLFMNRIRVLEKPVNLTYSHSRGDNRTMLDGTLVFDSSNKVSANHMFGSRNCKLKYTYVHGGVTTFEQSYDVVKSSWDFAVSRKVYGDDMFRASYQTSSNALGLEWSRNSILNGSFKISASLDLKEELKMPKLTAKSTWDFEIFELRYRRPLIVCILFSGLLSKWWFLITHELLVLVACCCRPCVHFLRNFFSLIFSCAYHLQ